MDAIGRLHARRDALKTVLRGGVEIIDEAEARIVYEWLVAELEKAETAISALAPAEEAA